MAARHEDGCYEKKNISSHTFQCLQSKGLSNDDVGAARDTVFQGIQPRAGFKTGDSVKQKLGGGYRRTARLIKEPRRSENVSAKKRYTLLPTWYVVACVVKRGSARASEYETQGRRLDGMGSGWYSVHV